jgi:hypothetical protein
VEVFDGVEVLNGFLKTIHRSLEERPRFYNPAHETKKYMCVQETGLLTTIVKGTIKWQ